MNFDSDSKAKAVLKLVKKNHKGQHFLHHLVKVLKAVEKKGIYI